MPLSAVSMPGDARLDVEAGRRQPLGDPAGREGFLVAELGVGVDPVAQAHEGGVRLGEEVTRGLLRGRPVHRGPFGGFALQASG